jgi:hypothetical protein
MDQLVRVGAVARVDPDPRAELDAWREDLTMGRIDDPEETRRRLAAQQRGEQIVVRLDMFAEVLGENGLNRYDGTQVSGAWFEVGAEEVNLVHAREMVAAHLDELYGVLTHDAGIDVPYGDVVDAKVAIEIDDELAQRLS